MSETFSLLGKKLASLAKERFVDATDVQRRVIPLIHQGKNVLVLAETGSGKTEAVLLPLFDRLLQEPGKPFSLLYITPLRSLNRDLLSRVLWWSERLGFSVSVRHGDTSQYERSMQAANPADMLIVTPETLQSILVGKVLRNHLKNVRFVVVDEAHELPDGKRGVQLTVALERLKALIQIEKPGFHPQIVGVSATVGSPPLVSKFLAGSSPLLEPVAADKQKKFEITVDRPRPTLADREMAKKLFVSSGTAARISAIHDLIKAHAPVLVFTNTREATEVFASRLKTLDPGLAVETHHSSLARDVRILHEQQFRDRKLAALVATSSLELGIDIGAVDLVVQYLSPRQAVKLAQRMGRAGHRHDKISKAVIITQDTEDAFESAVIARRVLSGWVEPMEALEKSWDVLAHQIVGLTLEKDIRFLEAHELLTKAFPYQNLNPDRLFGVMLFLQKLGLIRITDPSRPEPPFKAKPEANIKRIDDVADAEAEIEAAAALARVKEKQKSSPDLIISRRKRGWEYYYQNLSTIPDSKTYQLFDVVTHQPVGSLDAEFVSLYCQPGATIICKGSPWRILESGDRRVSAEPAVGIKASIPAWFGELIPVPPEVAQEVGALRREIAEHIVAGQDAAAFVQKKYPVTKRVAKRMVRLIEEQQSYVVPDDQTVVIEEGPEQIVMHLCGGSLVNDTLGRALSVHLTGKLGTVGLQTDPYRIVLTLPPQSGDQLAEAMKTLTEYQFKQLVDTALEKTDLFFLRFSHVAKRFGILTRDADLGRTQIRRIVRRFEGTPVYREALAEVGHKFDLPGAWKVLSEIQKHKREIVITRGLSPLAKFGVVRKGELVATEKPEAEIFQLFKKRLLDTKLALICCQCGGWGALVTAGEVAQPPVCKKCQARLIAVLPERYYHDALDLVKKNKTGKSLSPEEQRWLQMLFDSASLVVDHGYEAIRALAGRGVGPRTAARVLAKLLHGDDLLRTVLDAERQFVKTRQFWRG